MPQNRKTEAIELLNFIIEQYEINSDLKDIRLGQLLLNVVPNESLFFISYGIKRHPNKN